MNSKFTNLISLIAFVCIPALANASLISFNPKTDCKKLDAPHTLLIVHASWCKYCVDFLPQAIQVSNLPKYKLWSFYEVTDDEGSAVCGKQTHSFPTSYVKNINSQDSIIEGDLDAEALEKALDDADNPSVCAVAKK